MIKFAVLGFAALAIALPASADRGHGIFSKQSAISVDANVKKVIDVDADVLTKSRKSTSVLDLDAKVKGLVDVDADVLKTSRKSTSILDVDAKVGKLGAGLNLDVSRKQGLNLDLNLGKGGRRGGYAGGGYEDCGCDGGVGN